MFYTKKGSTLAALVWDTNLAAVLIFMANATLCGNALEIGFSHDDQQLWKFLETKESL